MDTVSRPGSERRLAALRRALLALFFALAPSSIPEWRTAPEAPPAAVLPVGEPIRMLGREAPAMREDLW